MEGSFNSLPYIVSVHFQQFSFLCFGLVCTSSAKNKWEEPWITLAASVATELKSGWSQRRGFRIGHEKLEERTAGQGT